MGKTTFAESASHQYNLYVSENNVSKNLKDRL